MALAGNVMCRQATQSAMSPNLHAIDNHKKPPRILKDTTGKSRERSCSVPREIKEEVEAQNSLTDEFADVQSIPETPQKSPGRGRFPQLTRTSDEKDQLTQVWLPLRSERRLKKRRTESIRSDRDTECVSTPSGHTDVGGEQMLQGSSSPGSPSRPREALTVTKLRPVPRGAPQIIERKGQYTIRKGVRIRDYRLPGPDPWPRAPPSSSLEYQCRDGFDEKESSLGYPQPMIAQKKAISYREAVYRHDRGYPLRGLSIGAMDPV